VLSYTLHHIHILIALYKGNIAIGNLHQFLPAILKLVQSDAKKRLLSLHALKEVCCYCSLLQYCKLTSPFKGCYKLFSGAVGRRSRSSVGAIVRELGQFGGDNSQCRSCVSRETHHHASFALLATTSRVSSLAKQRPKMLTFFVGRLEFATGMQRPERLLYLQSAIPSRIQHNHTTSFWRPYSWISFR
jgi:hypothetical protein